MPLSTILIVLILVLLVASLVPSVRGWGGLYPSGGLGLVLVLLIILILVLMGRL